MGFFSWMTSDTDESISNAYSSRGPLEVWVYLPDGSILHEPSYEGYGTMAGRTLMDEDEPRFATKPGLKYEDLSPARNCPEQGFFYDEDI
ncbi:MAG: hypothetical protein KJ630_22825 [Proteobacteria bacterium]|nr:hypothetical protein [Pseudomonadota bacterium]